MKHLKNYIRNISDFPKAGVQFKDITPLLKDPIALKHAVSELIHPFLESDITAVAGMEARGFIFGSLAASMLEVAFIPLRKPGKLPYKTQSISYDLEYASASLEVHTDALEKNDTVLLVDDLLATGGTAAASCEILEMLGAKVVACAFLIELDFLNGREKLARHSIHSLLHY